MVQAIKRGGSKGRPPIWTEEMMVKLARLWREGKSLDDISREMGMTFGSVKDKVYRLCKEGTLKKRVKTVTEEDKAEMVRLIHKGLTQQQVADVMGVSRSTVQGVLRRYAG